MSPERERAYARLEAEMAGRWHEPGTVFAFALRLAEEVESLRSEVRTLVRAIEGWCQE